MPGQKITRDADDAHDEHDETQGRCTPGSIEGK